MSDRNFNIEMTIKRDEVSFASILNEMAEYLESYESSPDHWEEPKRAEFYSQVRASLSMKAITMLRKL